MHFEWVIMPIRFNQLINYIDKSANFKFLAYQKSSKKDYNQICKLVSRIDKTSELNNFTFNYNDEFSKLMNSICSHIQIQFTSCDLKFLGD